MCRNPERNGDLHVHVIYFPVDAVDRVKTVEVAIGRSSVKLLITVLASHHVGA